VIVNAIAITAALAVLSGSLPLKLSSFNFLQSSTQPHLPAGKTTAAR
jgi:hypothetical protein